MPLEDVKERTKAIDIAVGQIEKQFGKGSIMRLGQRNSVAPIASRLERATSRAPSCPKCRAIVR